MNRRTALKLFAAAPLAALVPLAAQAETPDDPLPVLIYAVTPDGHHMAAVYNHPGTTDPCFLVPVYSEDAFRGFKFVWGSGMNRTTHFFPYNDGAFAPFDGGTTGHKLCFGPREHVVQFIRRHTNKLVACEHHLHLAYQQDERPPVIALYAHRAD